MPKVTVLPLKDVCFASNLIMRGERLDSASAREDEVDVCDEHHGGEETEQSGAKEY